LVEREREGVFLMPLGTRRDELAERGFRFTPRLHIDLWGDVRGRWPDDPRTGPTEPR
jgi:hypothetical protein